MSDDTLRLWTGKLFWQQQLQLLPFLLPLGYLVGVSLGLRGDEMVRLLLWLLPPIVLVFGVAWPWFTIRRTLQVVAAASSPADRLARLLEVPRRIDLGTSNGYMLASLALTSISCAWFGRSLWLVLVSSAVMVSFLGLIGIRQTLQIERVTMPLAVEAFHAAPTAELDVAFSYRPRLSWYLPYSFVALILCTVSAVCTVLVRKAQEAVEGLAQVLQARGDEQALGELRAMVDGLGHDVLLPLVGLGAFLIVVSVYTAFQLAQRIQRGAGAVQEALTALGSGQPKLANFIATDEMGDLARGHAVILDGLRHLSGSLRASAARLSQSAGRLGLATDEQREILARQASALHETQVTANEIRQTSALSADKSEAVLKLTARADEVSRAGADAVERSLSQLGDIRLQVDEMAGGIGQLQERARRIASITGTVKELADQSNMLALNAAIEAMRSGEHGRTFGIVAREMRSLADQSLRATDQVRHVLDDLVEAIRSTAQLSRTGAERVQQSLVEVRSGGESLRELSQIVRENAQSATQIAAAVVQQNAGIAQIFQAVRDLNALSDEALGRLEPSTEAAQLVRQVAAEVDQVVRRYGTDSNEPVPLTAPEAPPLLGV